MTCRQAVGSELPVNWSFVFVPTSSVDPMKFALHSVFFFSFTPISGPRVFSQYGPSVREVIQSCLLSIPNYCSTSVDVCSSAPNVYARNVARIQHKQSSSSFRECSLTLSALRKPVETRERSRGAESRS